MCNMPLAFLEMQLRSLDEASTSVSYCDTCGTSGSAMSTYNGRNRRNTIILTPRVSRVGVGGGSATRILPRSTSSHDIERVAWVEIYDRGMIKRLSSRKQLACYRYYSEGGVCSRTAIATVGGDTTVLRGWEYAIGHEVTYQAVGSSSSAIRVVTETRRDVGTPAGTKLRATRSRCSCTTLGMDGMGVVVLEHCDREEGATRALVPVLGVVDDLDVRVMELIVRIYSFKRGRARVTLRGTSALLNMVSPLVVLTTSFLPDPRVLVCHGDPSFVLPLSEVYPTRGIPS